MTLKAQDTDIRRATDFTLIPFCTIPSLRGKPPTDASVHDNLSSKADEATTTRCLDLGRQLRDLYQELQATSRFPLISSDGCVKYKFTLWEIPGAQSELEKRQHYNDIYFDYNRKCTAEGDAQAVRTTASARILLETDHSWLEDFQISIPNFSPKPTVVTGGWALALLSLIVALSPIGA